MNPAPFEDEFLDVLQNIEAAINHVYLDIPNLTDFEVDLALEALVRTYHGEINNKAGVLPHGPASQDVHYPVFSNIK